MRKMTPDPVFQACGSARSRNKCLPDPHIAHGCRPRPYHGRPLTSRIRINRLLVNFHSGAHLAAIVNSLRQDGGLHVTVCHSEFHWECRIGSRSSVRHARRCAVSTGLGEWNSRIQGIYADGPYVWVQLSRDDQETQSVVLRLPRQTTVADIIRALESVRFDGGRIDRCQGSSRWLDSSPPSPWSVFSVWVCLPIAAARSSRWASPWWARARSTRGQPARRRRA
jgi:hypothetical protein